MPTGVLSRFVRLLLIATLAGYSALAAISTASLRAEDPKPEEKTPKPSKPRKKPTSRPAKWTRDNAARLPWRTGERPVQLWPLSKEAEAARRGNREPIVLGGWRYESRRAANLADGVPWELTVTPVGENAETWTRGGLNGIGGAPMPMVAATRSRVGADRTEEEIPVIELPEVVWRSRMAADLQDVVGIHYHEFVSDDVARILFTVHKVPPDNADGTPNTTYQGKAGTRIEATLLTPVVWSLDQTIIVRVDNERTPSKDDRDRQTAYRIQHEAGHAGVSQNVLLEVLAGPQTWNPAYCEGRRSTIAYYWKRELVGKSWDGYQRGIDKVATLRTSVALVPPTRWSLMIPVPPARITQKHLQMMNDAIVHLGPHFAAADKAAQEKFHSHHGEFDQPVGP